MRGPKNRAPEGKTITADSSELCNTRGKDGCWKCRASSRVSPTRSFATCSGPGASAISSTSGRAWASRRPRGLSASPREPARSGGTGAPGCPAATSGRSNPLYGRVDVTVDLKPMDYYDSALFYPSFSEEDRVRLFSVFGGIPYYNRLIDSGLSVRENIIELIASQGARLENEVSLYLGSEISKISNANEVFGALSQGYSRYKDILAQSHVSSGPTMVDVLDKLIRMELVQKQVPINDPGNRRRVAYRIVDGLSLFYYRYVFRYASQLSVMNPEAFFDRFVADDFEHRYVPVAFEEVCRQYLVRQNRAGMLEEPFDLIGRYSYDDPVAHKNGEFDVVTHDSRGYAFYECKFRRTPVSRQMVSEEIARVEQAGLSCYKYGFFSRSGFDCAPEANQVFIGLSRLFE